MAGFWLISERENLRLFGRDWNNNDSPTHQRHAAQPLLREDEIRPCWFVCFFDHENENDDEDDNLRR